MASEVPPTGGAPRASRTVAAAPGGTEPVAASESSPRPGADERRLLIGAVATLALLSLPVTVVAWSVAGRDGAVSALIGIGLVLLLFGASAAALTWVAARRGGAGIGLLAGGALLRVPVYLAVLFALSGVSWVHGRSLAAATAVAVAVTLATELRLLAKMPRLFWVDAEAARPTATGYETRS